MEPLIHVLSAGMITPVGLDAPSSAAALRARITRVAELPRLEGSPAQVLGLVPASRLPPLHRDLRRVVPQPSRLARLLRLAGHALAEVGASWRGSPPPPLLLALPEPAEDGDDLSRDFTRKLQRQTSAVFSAADSQVFARGRAGGFLALARAQELLASGRATHVCVGGVDTHFDPALLDSLAAQRRLLGEGPCDGFIPGEGAAFLWLGAPARRRAQPLRPWADLVGAGLGFEAGHLYSDAPFLGDGLADAMRAALQPLPADYPKLRCVWAGLNGESIWSKAWGIAAIRSGDRLAPDARVEHIADCIGDPGAALGPMLLAVAAMAIRRGHRPAPGLVWCASDRGDCGAAVIQAGGAA